MSIIISKKIARDKQKAWYYPEWGKAAGQRVATGIFTYHKPKDFVQKNHNPQHRLKTNFLDYYEEYVKLHARSGNRH